MGRGKKAMPDQAEAGKTRTRRTPDRVPVRTEDVQMVIDFLETGVFWAVFTDRGLAGLLFCDWDDADAWTGDEPDTVPTRDPSMAPSREPYTASELGLEPLNGRLRLRIDLHRLLAEGKGNRLEQQLVRETVRFLKTGRHQLPLDFSGCTQFQQRVYAAVSQIKPGRLCTYKDVAMMIGQPTAARAVGNALAQEPVAYFLPAHRVVPQSGFGSCRSGAARSRQSLLEREGHDIRQLAGPRTCSRRPCCLD